MSVVKLDDKQKKRYKSSYKRNDSESENDSDRERQRRNGRKGCVNNSKKRKIKTFLLKPIGSKQEACVNSVIAKKVGDKHDEAAHEKRGTKTPTTFLSR
jgi:hypothetical protein